MYILSIKNYSSKENFNEIIIENLYFFLLTPISIVGLILNFFSFIVILNIKNKASVKFYSYLKIYTLSGSFICFFGIFAFYAFSPKYLKYDDDPYSRFFRCQVYMPILTLVYYFEKLIEILIIIDRLSIFMPKLKIVTEKSTTMIMSITMIISMIITSPEIFGNRFTGFKDKEVHDKIIDYTKDLMTICERIDFFRTDIGLDILKSTIFIRDILTSSIEMGLNITSIVYYMKFINKKSELKKTVFQKNSTPQTSSSNNDSNTIVIEKDKISKKDRSNFDKSIYVISLVVPFISIVCFIFASFTRFSIYINKNNTLFYFIIFVAMLIGAVRITSNFFVFYFFNSNFRNVLEKRQ